uniref:WD_REPEATS_REGION domain-containing protein n=1 Tax=Globodera pallida TaxID=36090 RepID=A0A183C030_GLOPA
MPLLFIGTNCGRCLLFSPNLLKQLAVLHADAQRRQIVAIGQWPFDERIQNATSLSDTECIIWLHFRCFSIGLFEFITDDGTKIANFRPLRELDTGHYGFCRAVADPVGGRMFMPDHEELNSSLRIRYRKGGDKLLVFGEEFMCRTWRRRTKHSASNEGRMFNGLLMGVEVLPGGQDQLLLAFEDSTVCVFDLHTNEVLDALKHPKRPEFLCCSVLCVASDTADCAALIAVSVIGQLYLLSYSSCEFVGDDAKDDASLQLLRAECKVKKCNRESECTALAMCSAQMDEQQPVRRRMAIGFKNGTIEIRAIVPPPFGPSGVGWTTTPLVNCDFHTRSICVLCWWLPPRSPDAKNGHGNSSDQCAPSACRADCSPILFSGASDGNVSLFVLSQ